MTTDFDSAVREADEAAAGPFGGFVSHLADRVGLHATAGAVFGDPVQRDNVTVIPVAKVRWAFGGGGGSGTKGGIKGADTGEGAGGGGAATASPIGYIEIRDGQASFRRIDDPVSVWPLVVASGFTAWLVLRGLRALFR